MNSIKSFRPVNQARESLDCQNLQFPLVRKSGAPHMMIAGATFPYREDASEAWRRGWKEANLELWGGESVEF